MTTTPLPTDMYHPSSACTSSMRAKRLSSHPCVFTAPTFAQMRPLNAFFIVLPVGLFGIASMNRTSHLLTL